MTRQIHLQPRPRRIERAGFALLLAGALVLAWPGGANAANIAVNVTNDELNGDGDCSLREAISAANGDSAVSGCPAGSGADTITVPAGTYRLRRVGASENGNATGDLDVVADVTITGAGGNLTIIDGNASDRVLHVLAGTVVVEDVVFQNGLAPKGADGPACINDTDCDESAPDGEQGGGILTQGGSNLTLRRVIVENNEAGTGGKAGSISCPTAGAECRTSGGSGGNGGGVSGNGALTIEQSLLTQNRSGPGGPAGSITSCGAGGDCFSSTGNAGDGGGVIISDSSLSLVATTVTDNESADWAGGVYCHHFSTCAISDSTIAYNHATFRGGGLTGVNTNATVANTTIGANTATGPGGGVSVFSGTMSLDFVTIAGNSAGQQGGGGIETQFGTLTMRNSLVADNTHTTGPRHDCSNGITSGGYNHVENLTGCTMALGVGDTTGTDPGLMGLADNGGPTETQALPPSSTMVDAIPAGTNGCGTTVVVDQRSATRPVDGDDSGSAACDKGAFELEGSTDCPAMPPVCDAATRSKLTIKDASPDAGKDTFKWTFTGGSSAITQSQLGDPTSGTAYDLCLYYGVSLRSAMRLADSSKWVATGTTGYRYADRSGAAAGITSATVKGGSAGKSKVTFTGKGNNLPDPLPMTPVPPSVTVVVRNSSTPTCFSAEYFTATKNAANAFTAP